MRADSWTLSSALGIGEAPELVAFTGGGGKSSLMFALAAELPGRTVITTTTRIFAAQMARAPATVYEADLSLLTDALDAYGRCLVVGQVEGEKAVGVRPDLPIRLLSRPDVDFVLVEADGSRMRPVKAPADHEPVIPNGTTLLVPVAGMDALAGPLDDVAHRPERIRELLGKLPSSDQELLRADRLTPAGLAKLLSHPQGGTKNAPDGARVIPFLNKVESTGRLTAARQTAAQLLREARIARVALGALRTAQPVHEVWRRVAAVVLAAGESNRMGYNKMLLPWGDTSVLGRTLTNVSASAVAEVIVVVGHERERVEPLVTSQVSRTIYNQDYAKGMITSVQAAVASLSPNVDAALIHLGDQPLVTPAIIDAIVSAYAASPHGLVAPVYEGRRGNPVLIDRRYFAELLALPPEAAPRTLLKNHPDDLHLVDIGSDAIHQDVDRPEDYLRLKPL